MPKPVYSSPGAAREAHDGLADALRPSLPALLYGSGDVTPPETDAATVGLLSHLTASYVAALVDAAVEAHDILTDGAGGILPPPYHSHGRVGESGGGGGGGSGRKRGRTGQSQNQNGGAEAPNRPRGREIEPGSVEDTWDTVEVPLPATKRARGRERPPPALPVAGAPANPGSAGDPGPVPSPVPPSGEWMGLAGVDLFVPRRRVPFASAPNAIASKSFIFPICHDAGLYGRVLEVQSARRSIAPHLVDPILAELVRTEGRQVVRNMEAGRGLGEGEAMVGAGLGGSAGLGGGGVAGSAKDSKDDGGDDDRNASVEKGVLAFRNGPGDCAIWPLGLEDLLPSFRGR